MVLSIFIKALAIYFIVTVIVYFIQEKIVFVPFKHLIITPDKLNMKYEDILLKSQDGVKIHGWYFENKGADYTILFLHGNAGNISHRLENVKKLLDTGFSVFIIDYRGYGKSEGKPAEQGVYSDAIAAYNFLINEKKVDKEKIVIFGRSLGGAIATHLATLKECQALIIESTLLSAKEVAKSIFPYKFFYFVTKDMFNNEKKINKVKVPVLFIHGKNDEIIPFYHGKKLYEIFKGKKAFYELKGRHNDTYTLQEKEYFKVIKDFVYKFEI